MITVYSKNDCVQCKMLKKQLDVKNIPYNEINVDEKPEYIEHVKSLGYSSVPVVTDGNISFSGFQPNKIKDLRI